MNIESFTRITVNKVKELKTEVTLQNPSVDSVFPCKVVRTALENIIKTEDGVPIFTRYSISIEEWATKKYDCMKMSQETAEKLRELNYTKTTNDIDIYDDITKKYRIVSTYEVNYNGIFNCFELIK